jgi:hypothetical protein
LRTFASKFCVRHPFTVSGLVWPDTQSSTGADTEMSVMDQGRSQGSSVHGAGVEPREAPPDGVTVHIKSMGAGSWSDRLYLDALEKQVCPKPETLNPIDAGSWSDRLYLAGLEK